MTDWQVDYTVNKLFFRLFVLLCVVPFLSNKYSSCIIFIQRVNMYAHILTFLFIHFCFAANNIHIYGINIISIFLVKYKYYLQKLPCVLIGTLELNAHTNILLCFSLNAAYIFLHFLLISVVYINLNFFFRIKFQKNKSIYNHMPKFFTKLFF